MTANPDPSKVSKVRVIRSRPLKDFFKQKAWLTALNWGIPHHTGSQKPTYATYHCNAN